MKINKLKKFEDSDGTLVPISFKDLEFHPNRIFYVKNVPKKEVRGNHAHIECQHILVCIKGIIVISVFNGNETKHYELRPDESIYIDKMLWDYEKFITGDDILLVLCSHEYDSEDYIHDIKEFERIINDQSI